MYVKSIFYRDFRGRKIISVKMNGEKFTVHFSDGEILVNLTISEFNHIVVTATGR